MDFQLTKISRCNSRLLVVKLKINIMTQAQLQKGDNLSTTIGNLKNQLDKWKKSNDFYSQYQGIENEKSNFQVDWDLINRKQIFFVVRAIAISELETKISELEKEFDSL